MNPRRRPASTTSATGLSSTKELLDVHTQLRHEASGLRFQLAAKQVRKGVRLITSDFSWDHSSLAERTLAIVSQEVLERSVLEMDRLAAELSQARVTIASQGNLIDDLQGRLQMALRKAADAERAQQRAASCHSTPRAPPPLAAPPEAAAPAETWRAGGAHPPADDDAEHAEHPAQNPLPDGSGAGDDVQPARRVWRRPPAAPGDGPGVAPLQPDHLAPHELVPHCKITMAARASRPGSAGGQGDGADESPCRQVPCPQV